jgi:predicted HicB family RNase H-like nuclease
MKMALVKKYTYRIEWSAEDDVHIARCLEFPSLLAHGNSPDQALREIEAAVAASINWMNETKEPVPEPLGIRRFKGNLTLRVSPDLHRELAIRAREAGVSVNQFILSKL